MSEQTPRMRCIELEQRLRRAEERVKKARTEVVLARAEAVDFEARWRAERLHRERLQKALDNALVMAMAPGAREGGR